MALPILKGLVANYGKLGYQVWHRPLKMASLVYEREIGRGAADRDRRRENSEEVSEFFLSKCSLP